MNEHERCLGRAQDYFSGLLGPAEREAWEAHRHACTACAALLERWPHAALVPDLGPAVLAALGPGRSRPRARPAWALPLALGLALAVLLAAFWHPERQWLRDDHGYGDTCLVAIQGGLPCCVD